MVSIVIGHEINLAAGSTTFDKSCKEREARRSETRTRGVWRKGAKVERK